MLSLEKTEIEDAAVLSDRLNAQRDQITRNQITRLEAELAASSSALDVLKDKHNRFTGMIMAAMADEIKVLISGEVSEQLSNISVDAPDWNVDQHRNQIMDVVRDDFDIDDHQCEIENLIDNHFSLYNYSDNINDMIRDYINDCTVTIDTP